MSVGRGHGRDPAFRYGARRGLADTSPARLPPAPAPVVMITGGVDAVTPPAYASSYVEQRKAAGGSAELVIVPDAAHFDVVTLDTPAWNIVEPHIPAP